MADLKRHEELVVMFGHGIVALEPGPALAVPPRLLVLGRFLAGDSRRKFLVNPADQGANVFIGVALLSLK